MGYKVQEFIDDSDFLASNIHPEDRESVYSGLPVIFENGGLHTHEYRFKHRNGSFRWVCDDLRLVRDAQGNPKEIIGSLFDITEQK